MRRGAIVIAGALLAAGVAARLSNGWSFPALGSYDAFSHFTYIWYLARTGEIPVASQGWSYFHPPLYYGFMAAVWKLFDGSDPLLRLRIGTTAIAALGLLHPLLAWRIARRRAPGDPAIAMMAGALLLFVPVMLYSAGFLGNEGLHAVLGSLSLVALLRLLKQPGVFRALVLGLCLGLAMLAKFSAVTIVAAAMATLVLRNLGRSFRGGWKVTAIAAAAAVLVCGPYYARNIHLYGDPFAMARDRTFMTAYVEKNQPQAARSLADYLTFDPVVFRRPQWPRGSTPSEDSASYGFARSVRESVWTGLYANTWFDGFGGWVLPPVTESESSRRAGQVLLLLGLLPTGLMLAGIWSAAGMLRRRGWDDEIVVFGLATASMLLLFVYGTRQAPIAAAVKATYFTPVCLAFSFWFALGLLRLRRSRPSWFAPAALGCTALAAVSLAVFWQGLLFDPATQRSSLPGYEQARQNQYGVIEYAGGRTRDARAIFESGAASGYALAVENLAFVSIDAGRLREGLRLLRRAARLHGDDPGAGPLDRERFHELTAAEYAHSVAVVLYGLGRREKAVAGWNRALQHDPGHAEALLCLTLARLQDDLATATDASGRRAAFDDAERGFANVRALDPGLEQGWLLAASVQAARGDCEAARRTIRQWHALPCGVVRRFPAEAGNGAGLAASVGRRRLIAPARTELQAGGALAGCGLATGG